MTQDTVPGPPPAPPARRAALAAMAAAVALAARPASRAAAEPPAPPPPPAGRLVGVFAAGSPSDEMASALAAALEGPGGLRYAVEHRPSPRGSAPAMERVARAEPDGATLLIAQPAHVMADVLFPGLSADPVDGFAPVALWAEAPMVAMVASDAPWRTLGDLLADFRRQPGRHLYATNGAGTNPHIAARLLLDLGGAEARPAVFTGIAAAREAVVSGRVAFLTTLAPDALPGRSPGLRPLAVLSAARLPALPTVPTAAEQATDAPVGAAAAARTRFVVWNALLAPAALPADAALAINGAVDRALRAGGLADRIAAMGAVPLGGLPPAEVREFLRAERARLRPLAANLAAGGAG